MINGWVKLYVWVYGQFCKSEVSNGGGKQSVSLAASPCSVGRVFWLAGIVVVGYKLRECSEFYRQAK